ncbi:MAG: hypothetical protein BHW64_02140 [Candidatus Melainabacteria bacterium LEY3_CP_29_8]|nr:MAG: hypothetical protein BHW64_02140 [Candidatus Melainabacteria bacterium LEY3_CP_29_8]
MVKIRKKIVNIALSALFLCNIAYCTPDNMVERNTVLDGEKKQSLYFPDLNEEQFVQLKKMYKEEKTPIVVSGKVLKNKEIDEIQAIIKKQIDVEIDFDMPKTLGLSSIKRTFNQEIAVSETKFHRGSLRSGQKLETEGSIVILGDVNSGAEVMASDNIVVLGALRGLAHAGAKGNMQAMISAGLLDTVQIRIANVIKEIDRDEEPLHKQAYVSIIDGEIIIE